jgi:hypothetical protein
MDVCLVAVVKPSKVLKKVEVPIWKNADCLKAYKEANYDFTREGYVCAGDYEKDSSKVHLLNFIKKLSHFKKAIRIHKLNRMWG